MTNEHIPTVGPNERFTPETIEKLDGALNESRIVQDRDGNLYLEGWDAIAAANAYFGFDGWRTEIVSVESSARFQALRNQGTSREHMAEIYLYVARVRVTAGGVSHEDVGTSPTATDTAEAHETAIKAAVTDGLKRALRHFGAQFGNDLYDKGRATPQQQVAAPQPPPRAQQPVEHDQVVPIVNAGWFFTKCFRELRLPDGKAVTKPIVLELHHAKNEAELESIRGDQTYDAFFEETKALIERQIAEASV